MEKINISNINKYKGKILAKESSTCIWLFKFIKLIESPYDKNEKDMLVTNQIDVFPAPFFYAKDIRAISRQNNFFYNTTREAIPKNNTIKLRLPTKDELLRYTNYTRAIRILGKDSTNKGEKIYNKKHFLLTKKIKVF